MLLAEENRERSRFESEGEITIRGGRVPYRTVCEDNFILDADGNPAGTVFSYAYFRSDVKNPESRPVLFGFNGGPGSGSQWLHLGILGPKRIRIPDEMNMPTTPPFELEDNPNCLLDMCDIVLVDPVGCGLGRLFNDEKKENMLGFNQDAYTLALFMEAWLTRYNRRNSPILLFGESYGTGRIALLLAELYGASGGETNNPGISVSGVMFLGCYFFDPLPVEQTALNMSSMAATNWYHNPEGKPSLEEFFEQAHEFTANEYIPAIFKGDELPPEERERVVKRMSHFLGISEEYILDHRMRIDIMDFKRELLRDTKEIVGLYDGRYKWKDLKHVKNVSIGGDDPAMGVHIPAFQAGMSLLRKELGITFDRASRSSTWYVSQNWIRKLELTPADALAAAMRRNPALKAFFATGKYDLCTTAGIARYLAYHSNLDTSRVQVGTYPSGHMAYIGEEGAAALAWDMREFFESALK